jgi:cyclic dehypoxanthinyl futalosine synthase
MPQASTQYVLDKAAAGERLYFDECLQIYREAGLLELGMTARAARQLRVPGRMVTYLVDRNINYTNVCTTGCQFCGYHRPPDHAEAYVITKSELSRKIEELVHWGGTRILLQGGHNPKLMLDWYMDLLQWLKAMYPDVERDCFSPSEIDHIARASGLSTREVLVELQKAGLQGLPGSGAEVLDDEIRDRFSPKKLKTDAWLSIMREAQELGLNTSATMVIGLNEKLEHRMRHLQRIRDLQEYSMREHGNGFIAFISWTMQYSETSSLGRSGLKDQYSVTAHEYLRHATVARIFLDNILHHQVSWVTQGAKIGQISLEFGMDDFGSTMLEENVVSSVNGGNEPGMTEAEIHRYIRNAGYTPAKRDTIYNIVKVFDNPEDSPTLQPSPPQTVPVVADHAPAIQVSTHLN